MKTKSLIWSCLLVGLMVVGLLGMGCPSGDDPKDPTPVADSDAKPGSDAKTGSDVEVDNDPEIEKDPEPATEAPASTGEVKSYHFILEVDDPTEGKQQMEYKGDDAGRVNMRISKSVGDTWELHTHILVDGENTYVLDPAKKSGMKMPVDKNDPATMMPEDMMVPTWDAIKKDAEANGGSVSAGVSAEVKGVKTTKYIVSGGAQTQESFVYVDKSGVVRRVELQPTGPGGKGVTMDFIKVELNVKLTDADFTPPSDYTLMDMSEMMKNMPDMGDMPDMPDMPK